MCKQKFIIWCYFKRWN